MVIVVVEVVYDVSIGPFDGLATDGDETEQEVLGFTESAEGVVKIADEEYTSLFGTVGGGRVAVVQL